MGWNMIGGALRAVKGGKVKGGKVGWALADGLLAGGLWRMGF